jgi:alpha,alpha-trehalase
LAQADRDADGRISVHDEKAGGLAFVARTPEGPVELRGAEALAHLSDLLARRVMEDPRTPAVFTRGELLESRGATLHELVRRSWWRLARRADRVADLVVASALNTDWPGDGKYYLYYPQSDPAAGRALAQEVASAHRTDIELVALPRHLDATWYARLEQHPGMLYLPSPYVVPGGRFNELYGWDSYFMGRGALADGYADLAQGMLDDLLYQIEHYGKIGNSNKSIHRSRSQPPFLIAYALALADSQPPGERRTAFLRRVAEAGLRELSEVWLAPPRVTETGLSLYHDEMATRPPEVPAEFYGDWRDEPTYYAHQRAVRESGWDMTYRFDAHAQRILPVDLNALLYRYERDLAEVYRRLEGPSSSEAARLEAAAARRRETVDRLMWDPARGLYFDFDLERGRRRDYEHVGSFYALWAGLASPEQARRVVQNLPLFEMPGGLAVSSERSRRAAGGNALQWDWPFGWAPHQVIAVEGLRRYGYEREAERIARAWTSMILDVAAAHDGLVMEKYDVVHRTADVPAEYGNQGGDRGPLAIYSSGCKPWPRPADCVQLNLAGEPGRPVGFGWTNASLVLLGPAGP